jgi:hypothetical protein
MSELQILISLLEDHQSNGFWVGNNIPKRKLDNAIAHFPIDPKINVLGLIDCTVMGSCKNGLAITDHGLIWKNGWTSSSGKTSLTWKELLETKNDIKLDKYEMDFGKNAKLNMAGCSIGKTEAFNLFHGIAKLLGKLHEGIIEKGNADYIDFNEPSLIQKLPDNTTTNSISDKEQELYEESLISALALMTVADGEVESDEIELVTAFVIEEESIKDEQKALSDFESHIDKLTTSQEKSKSIFNLQSGKLIAGIKKLKDQELIDRLEIMLEGMMEAAGGLENKPTVEMMKKIMRSFS